MKEKLKFVSARKSSTVSTIIGRRRSLLPSIRVFKVCLLITSSEILSIDRGNRASRMLFSRNLLNSFICFIKVGFWLFYVIQSAFVLF